MPLQRDSEKEKEEEREREREREMCTHHCKGHVVVVFTNSATIAEVRHPNRVAEFGDRRQMMGR